jgi:uncharacterized protein with ATP-grasp and redox domains
MEALRILQSLPENSTPPEISRHVHRAVREITANPDPYLQAKAESTQKALALLPRLRAILAEADDPLETAVRLSIAGNIMDFGPNPQFDLWEVVERILEQPLAINDLETLRQRLSNVRDLLYLADNAGETVFDRLLIETLKPKVVYVVKGGPVLNDATYEDAVAAGIDQVAEVVDNGTQITGTIIDLCSPEFQARFRQAELIISKGMGNYETLSTVKGPIFHLMQVKCPVIGMDVGAPQGSVVVKQGLIAG